MRLESPPRIAAAVGARLAATPPVARLAQPASASRAGFWKSFGAWAGIGLFSGLLNVGLKAAFSGTTRTAFDPLLWKINNTAQESLGARFNDSWSNPVKAAAARFIAPPKQTDSTLEVFHPALAAELAGAFVRRSAADDRVRGAADTFYAAVMRMLQMVCEGVRDRIAAGDHDGAARRLAAALVHDRALRYEFSPSGESIYALLYARLKPYFAALDKAGREAMVGAVLAEVGRLSLEASRPAALVYAEAVVRGLTGTQLEAPPKLVVGTPMHVAAAKEASRDVLASILAAETDTSKALRDYVDAIFAKALEGARPFAKLAAHRARRRVSLAVARELVAFETKIGRPATIGELWELVGTAIGTDASATIEARATSASVGAFVAVGAVAAIPKAAMGKLDPALAAALDPLIFATVGLFMGAAGKFFKERLDAFGRSLAYSTPDKVQLGIAVERDLLDAFLRVLSIDSRTQASRRGLMQLERLLHLSVIDAEECYRRDDLVGAAQFLSGAMQYLAATHSAYSPLSKSFDIVALKLGPHFDGLTLDQIERLRALVLEDLRGHDVGDEAIARYHLPLITALLTRNVSPRDA